MRSSRFNLVLVTVAATVIGACGSSAKPGAAPPGRVKLSLAAAADEGKAALYPLRATRYVLDGTLADLGADAPVRKLVGHEVTDAEAARLAGGLGLHATPVRTGTGYEVLDGDARLTIDTSSGVTYVDYSRTGNAGGGSEPGSVGSGSGSSGPSTGATSTDTKPPVPGPDTTVENPPVPGPDTTVENPPATVPLPTTPPPVDVPSADDAVTIAQTLLDDLGVLAGQPWAHDVSDSGGVAVSCGPDTPCLPAPSEVTARTVTFELLLDGARVPGVSWSVTVGSHRLVESVSGAWGAPELAGTYPLRSTADVFDDLRNGRAQHVGPQPLALGAAEGVAPDVATGEPTSVPPIEVRITGVSLGAARWDGTENGHPVVYLLPTYRFHAREADAAPYDVEVLALEPADFAIVGPVTEGVPKSGGTPGRAEPLTTPADTSRAR